MEQGYELRLTDIRKAVLEQSQNNELYIPLHGKHTINPEEEPFDLAEKIQLFFEFDEASANDPKVMLLMGDTGFGKSVFSQQLHQQLWGTYTAGDPIPLWIPLPELENPFESAVEEVLKKYGFDDGKIAEIKSQERFVFIVDGYDELHQFQNCYVTNKWEKWNAKVLITCRSQALYYQKDPDKYFMPFNGEKRLPMLLRKLYVAAFSKEQISVYVKQYQQLNSENNISEEDFSKVPGLAELINTPFLLHLAVEVLPDILAGQADNEKMTQAKLYDVFIERWFTRQVKKLSIAALLNDTEQKTKQQFWDYCKRLAQKMHEKQVCVIPYQGQKMDGRLFGKPAQNSHWDSFFNEETELVRSACPLRRFGEHHYGFVHASMVEYFATRSMYDEIQNNETIENIDEKEKDEVINPLSQDSRPCGGIHQRIFTLERQCVQFLADRIEMSGEFKQKMLVILDASKKNKYFAIGAANAITALVRAGVTFNNANLSRINIRDADISGGYFDHADISDADLSNVQMFHVWLNGVSLERSLVEGINFGEYPWFKHEKFHGKFDYREDLQYLAMACGGKIVLHDINTGGQFSTLTGHTRNVNCLQISPDGELLVSGSEDRTIRIWSIDRESEVAILQGNLEGANCVAFSPDGKTVVAAVGSRLKGSRSEVQVWDVATESKKLILLGHMNGVYSVQFSPDGERIVSSGGDDHTVRIWEASSGRELVVLGGHMSEVLSVQFSLSGERLVSSGSWDNTIRIWDPLTRGVIVCKLEEKGRTLDAAFSPDEKLVVVGSQDAKIRIWEVSSATQISVLQGHKQYVSKVLFSLDGSRIISGSNDATIRVWDIKSGTFPARTRGHNSSINSLQINKDGKWVLSGGEDKTIRIWDVASGKENIMLQEKENVNCVVFSSNEQYVLSSTGRLIHVWDLANSQVIAVLQGHESNVNSVAMSLDGKRIVSGSSDRTIRIWEVEGWKLKVELRGRKTKPMEGVNSVAISRDGKRLVSGSDDSTIRIWDMDTNHEICASWRHNGEVITVAFSGDGERVVSGGEDNYVRIWDARCGDEIAALRGHEGKVFCAIFNSDGKHIISGSADETIRIWDVKTERCILVYKLHSPVKDVTYHDNNLLIIGFLDGSLECYRANYNESNYHFHLCWTTDIDSRSLYVEGLQISHIIGLSDQNRRMLEQRGALADAKSEAQGSPIHHQVSSRSQQGGQELIDYYDPKVVQQSTVEGEESDNEENEKNRCHRCLIA